MLADVVVVIHLVYVVFAVGGQLALLGGIMFSWGWIFNPVFRIVHLVAVGLVGVEAAAGVSCPLTLWEYALRRLAGQSDVAEVPFIARLAGALIYYDLPQWTFTVAHIVFGLLVVATFVIVPPRFSGRPRGKPGAGP